MRKSYAILAAAVVAGVASMASAAPLVNVSILGKVHGTADAYAPVVTAQAGQTIDIELVADMAPVGTVNTAGTITSIVSGTDGANSFKFNMKNITGAPVALSAVTLDAAWTAVTGASGGTLNATTGVVENIRPGKATGQFGVGVVATGSVVATGDSFIGLAMPTAANAGSLKINGGAKTLFITDTTEKGADPLVGYPQLHIAVPEPTSLGLLAVGALGLLARRRQA